MARGFAPPNYVQIPDNGIIPNAPLNLNYSVAAKDLHHPYLQSWNFALQRQLPIGFSLDLAYVGNQGVSQNRSININQGTIPGSGSAGQPYFHKFGKTANISSVFLYYNTNYHGLQARLNRRFAHGFSSTSSYTWSHSIDYNSQSVLDDGTTFTNPAMFRRNRATSGFNRTHSFVQSLVYELPFGPNRPWLRSGAAAWVAGGWQLNGVFTAMTGPPLNISISGTSLNMPGVNNKPNVLGEVKILEGVGPGELWFDTSAFAAPPAATFGNLGRNVLRGPGFVNLDASLFRKFPIRERMSFELRFETFNTTNTPHFDLPGTTFGTATFGVITTTVTGDNRSVQLGAKLLF